MNWPVSVYRLFGADNRLLYVGCSADVHLRLIQHRCTQDWFPAVTRTTVEKFPTREEALAAELAAIRTESPIHNVKGKGTEPRERETVDLYWRVPAELRDRIKAHAALERLSMNELVARVMDAAVLRDRDLESARQAMRRTRE